MLKKNPSERITAEQALRHEYLLEEEEGSEIACFDDEEGPGN
jgi:hypothetical protein